MIINNKRALAYIQTVHDIRPIAGADSIEQVHVLGWELIAKINEFKEGDKCVYIEIDSKVPSSVEAFSFLASRGFKVKTYVLRKFGVVSQGLALPVSMFPELVDLPVNTDVTEKLGITYSVAEDNVRKAATPPDIGKKGKLNNFISKHKQFFNSTRGKRLLSHKFSRWIIGIIASICFKPVKPLYYPSFVIKTDEERIQNIPQVLTNKQPLIVTEKVDGTSSTYALERKGKKFIFSVCSRNRNLADADGTSAGGVYWEMAHKYDIEKHLHDYLIAHPKCDYVVLQGESFGAGLQGNPLKQKTSDLRVFNFIDSVNRRHGSVEGKKLIESWGMKWVPIIYTDYVLPDTVDELIAAATGPSAINPQVLREGWVIRDQEGRLSFKAVSTTYLLQKGE